MEFNHKYYCRNCGRLLIKSARPLLKENIEIVCPSSDCKERQVVCEHPLPFHERLENIGVKHEYEDRKSKQKEFIRKRFIAEKRLLAKYK